MATADSSATTPSKTPLETLQQYETAFKQRKTALQQTIEEIEDIQNNRYDDDCEGCVMELKCREIIGPNLSRS